MLLKLPFSFWKKKYFVEFNIWERTRKFQFWKRKKDYIIAMENLKKNASWKKKRMALKILWRNHPKRVNVSKIYICIWRLYLVFTWLCIQYPWIPHISPFIVKQPPIIFFLLSVPVFYDYHVSGAFWIDFRLFEILE